MKINASIWGIYTSPFAPTSESLITFSSLLCSNKMLLSSLHFSSSDKERKHGRRRTSRTQAQGKRFTTLTVPMEAWCLSELQQICMLSGEFSALPAKNAKQRGLFTSYGFTAWNKDTWKSPCPPWIPSLYLFCKGRSHIQLFNIIWA